MESKNIKICHVVSVDITIKFLLMPQLKFLKSQGYDVYVVCSWGKLLESIEKEGIKVKTIKITRKISPISDVISLVRLFLYFRKEKFDIIHTHAPKPGLLGQLAAKLAGVPMIINTVHGLYFTENSSYAKRAFFILMERIAAQCSTFIFSQNREDMITIVKEKISGLEKMAYLGNGVDIEKFNPKRFSEEFIIGKKKEIGLPEGFIILGVIGRLVEEKGYLDIFSAFKKVLDTFPKTILLVVGPEESEKKDAFSKDIVKRYAIENNVIFLGERMDVDELYSVMDIFVLPSHREGFPRTIIEAMASRKPIIASNIRGCREAIDNGVNGVLFPVHNIDRLYNAIIFLLENPKVSKNMADLAREKAEREFNEELVFNRIKEKYEDIIRKKGKK